MPWLLVTNVVYSVYTQTLTHPLLLALLQVGGEESATDLFDPATSKLGGVAILTIHLGIMAQLKKFFLVGPLRRVFDFLNYPVAFLLIIPILPPWPVWEFAPWANYVGGSIALAVLASVTAQKVRDAVPKEDIEEANIKNAELREQSAAPTTESTPTPETTERDSKSASTA